jgi:Dyp-type peroxidase family
VIQSASKLRYKLDLDQIQGDIVPGFKKDYQGYLFFTIKESEVQAAKDWLREIRSRIVQSQDVATAQRERRARRLAGEALPVSPTTWLNIALSSGGLWKLRPAWQARPGSAYARAPGPQRVKIRDFPREVTDPDILKGGKFGTNAATTPDIVLIVGADTPHHLKGDLDSRVVRLRSIAQGTVYRLEGTTLGNAEEHFGFRDAISQPSPDDTLLDGWLRDDPGDGSGPQVIAPGEIVRGYADETNPRRPKNEPDPTLLPWEINGSYLVFLRLEQLVGEFRKSLRDEARRLGIAEELLAAKVVGRWRTGARLRPGAIPSEPPPWDPSEAAIPGPDYAADLDGRTVPLFAHIRKANPRLVGPEPLKGYREEEAAQAPRALDPQRHRLVRRSIPYGDKLPPGDLRPNDYRRGLLFVSYQASIERQFEHVLRVWLGDRAFSPVPGSPPQGADPVAVSMADDSEIPTEVCLAHHDGGPSRTVSLARSVIARAGGYFFAPSIAVIDAIITGREPPKSVASGDISEEDDDELSESRVSYTYRA